MQHAGAMVKFWVPPVSYVTVAARSKWTAILFAKCAVGQARFIQTNATDYPRKANPGNDGLVFLIGDLRRLKIPDVALDPKHMGPVASG